MQSDYIGNQLQGGVRGGGTPNFDSWILLTDSGVCSGVNAIHQAPLQGAQIFKRKIFKFGISMEIVKMVKPYFFQNFQK